MNALTASQLLEALFSLLCYWRPFAHFYTTDLSGICKSSGQLQIEIHGKSYPETLRLFRRLEAHGLRLFSKEANHCGCDGTWP